MRDYFILAIILGSVPLCIFRPYIGVLVWAWISYMNPHRLTWSFAKSFPVAQVVGIAVLLGAIFARDREKLPMERETVLMLLLWITITLVTFFAFFPSTAWEQWTQFTKVLLMTFVTIVFSIDKKRLKYFLLTIAFSIGFYGFKGGIFAILTGGAYRIYGPEGSFIGGNNSIAVALLIILPILFFLAREEPNLILKIVLRVTFLLSIISVIFSYSRGAFLGLAAIISLFILRSKKKWLAGVVALVGVYVAFMFIPEQWFERIETIQNYEQDRSAMGRINAWHVSWKIALARPLTGGGFGTLEHSSSTTQELYAIYLPDSTTFNNVHSIYFEMLGEQGFIAFGLFLSLFISSFLSFRKLRKTFKHIPSCQWICSYCDMLELSLVAYMVGGAFVGLAYFDLFYHLVAMVIILKVLAKRESELLIKEKKYPNKRLVTAQLSIPS